MTSRFSDTTNQSTLRFVFAPFANSRFSTLHASNDTFPRFRARVISLEELPILIVSVGENGRSVILRRTSEKR